MSGSSITGFAASQKAEGINRKVYQRKNSWDVNQHSHLGCGFASNSLMPFTMMLTSEPFFEPEKSNVKKSRVDVTVQGQSSCVWAWHSTPQCWFKFGYFACFFTLPSWGVNHWVKVTLCHFAFQIHLENKQKTPRSTCRKITNLW